MDYFNLANDQDSMVNKADYVELGLACADACRALDRGMNGKRLDNPNHSVYEAVAQLRMWVYIRDAQLQVVGSPADDTLDRRTVTEIQKKVFKQRGRSAVSRLVHAKNDKETIAAWRSDLNRVLHVFTVRSPVACIWVPLTVPFQAELVMSTHMVVSDLHRKMVPGQEGTDARHPVSATLRKSTTERLPLPRLEPGRLPRIPTPWGSFRTAPLSENRLPRHRGLVSGAAS